MSILSVGAVLLFTPTPEALVAFYREALGLPLEQETHPGAPPHFGCRVGEVQLAIHDSRLNQRQPGIAFSLTTFALDGLLEGIASQGVQPLHRPIDMGGGAKRVAIRDPDGNTISLVQLADAWAKRVREKGGARESTA